jgi:hypothetical protein
MTLNPSIVIEIYKSFKAEIQITLRLRKQIDNTASLKITGCAFAEGWTDMRFFCYSPLYIESAWFSAGAFASAVFSMLLVVKNVNTGPTPL